MTRLLLLLSMIQKVLNKTLRMV